MKGEDYLILLLGANNYAPIRGKLALQKEMFLMSQELDKSGELMNQLKFEGYNYGPYSKILENLLKKLEYENIVRTKPDEDTKVYELTENGKEEFTKIFSNCENFIKNEKEDNTYANLLDDINKLKIGSERLGYKGLLRYVYFNYPKFIDKSKIKNEVLGGN